MLSDIPPEQACVPEVVVTATDSTETILTTFEATCSPQQYQVDLRQWGMEFGDFFMNDPAQGDLTWRLQSGANFQNMPSAPTILYNITGGYGHGTAEFLPPVRKVEFHYSALKGTRAVWNGQFVEHSDSFVVRVYDSLWTPLASRVLYSNASSTVPPWNVWTPVTLESPAGDNIRWLRLDGTAHLDNVRITRSPLTCTQVTRAGIVTCKVVTGGTIGRWTFTPSDTLLPVRDTVGVASWSGRLVAEGTVSVVVGASTYRAKVKPSPRGWASSWPSKWSLNTTLPLVGYDGEPNPLQSGSNYHGANCVLYQNTGYCSGGNWYEPHPETYADSIGVASVTDFGPNRGYWYVTRVPYHMWRVGAMTEGAKVTSPRRHFVPNASASCKKGLGIGSKDSAFANWYQFNQSCAPSFRPNMAQLTGSIFGHEGRGYNGGQGHQARAEAAAGQAQNDPYATLEKYVGLDPVALVKDAESKVISMDARVKAATADPLTGNWLGYVWYWFPSTATWDKRNVAW